MSRSAWALVVGILVALVGLWVVQVSRITNHHDFEVQYLAAQRLRSGENIYADSLEFKEALVSGAFSMADEDVRWPYANPPLLAILTVPLTLVQYETAAAFWWILNLALLLGGCAMVLAAIRRLDWVGVVVSLALLFAFYPATVCLRLGQVEILLFALMAGSFLALKRGKDVWAGSALGLAAAIKFFPGALLVFLLWKRRWKAALWGIGVAVAALALSIAVVGADNFQTYTQVWSVYTGGAFSAFPFNQSLNGFFSRLFRPNVFWPTWRGLELPGLATGLWVASMAALGAGLAWLTRRPVPVGSHRFDVEFSAAVLALLLAQPHSQVYAFVWLLLPLVVLGCRALGTLPWSWLETGVLLVGYFAAGRQWLRLPPIPVRFVRSHITFGALLLVALAFYILWRKSPTEAG